MSMLGFSLRVLAMVALAYGAHAQDKQAPAAAKGGQGRDNALAMCTGCHGIPGYKTAYPVVYHVPKIGGQSPAYLANALKAYRAGDRWHPSMRGIAASLTDADIEQIAAYYGSAK
jgi:cytochrome c553